jgi:retron-type reverse transcriptase
MGLFDWIRRLLRTAPTEDPYHSGPQAAREPVDASPDSRPRTKGRGLAEVAQWIHMPYLEVTDAPLTYERFSIPKRGGGVRQIDAPNDVLKDIQRRILRCILAGLKAHPAVHGFEKGRSIVTNAAVHADQAVVIRMDIRDFFHSTSADRVEDYFRRVGWDRKAAGLLTRLTTNDKRLAQGAPTSPRLANLVNYQMDVRLAGLAQSHQARYTRYADDLTFSLSQDRHRAPNLLIASAKCILADYGYTLHHKRKLHIRRRHQRQDVTGLTVNQGVRLPRRTRRRLRAIRHRLATTGQATLTPEQLAGWDALESMIATQSAQRD